jgi:Flp pilus assembly protein TadD
VACGSKDRAPAPTTAKAAKVTFNKDVAPILFANCASCHRPGEVAPFPLLTFDDAKKHAEEIAEETRERHMPPWLPEPGEFPVMGSRRLKDADIAVLQEWFKQGTPEGAAADLPKPPAFVDGWQLGKPDRVLTLARPYSLKPGKDDVYRNVVVRTSLAANAFVRAVEFKTGGAPVHHAVIRVDPTSASRRRDGEDGQPGFDGMTWQSAQDPGGQFIGWTPGRGPIVTPEGMPWRLDRGSDLVVELHLIPSDAAIPVSPTIALYLTDTPPKHTPITVKMGSKLIDIPAGKSDYVVTDSYQLPVDVDLLSIYPHAHYLGREMLVTASFPGGAVKKLLEIKRWDFHWQQDYRYTAPIALPRGTTLTMRYTYDNSDENTENPHHPPVRVRIGPRAVDEMANLGLQILPKSQADATRLTDDFDARDKQAEVVAAEWRVREAPGVAELESALGAAYVEVRKFAEAIPHLQAAVKLNSKLASAHNYLGGALVGVGRASEAIAHFRQAIALQPGNEWIHFNLGNAFTEANQAREAIAAYERALAIRPEFAEAHGNLGTLLFVLGRRAEAITRLRRAAQLAPDSATAHSDLGTALAEMGQRAEALTHIRRALEIRPDHAPALQVLKRLQ